MQRQAQRGQIGAFTTQNRSRQRQELSLLDAGVLLILAHQALDRRPVDLGRIALEKLFQMRLQLPPLRLDVAVLSRELIDQASHALMFFTSLGLGQHDHEQILFLLGVVGKHRLVEEVDRLLRNLPCACHPAHQARQFAEVVQVRHDADVTLREIIQR